MMRRIPPLSCGEPLSGFVIDSQRSSVVILVRILKADLDGLAIAASVVAKGGAICYPTDTVYGLGCDPINSSAVERVINVKGPRAKPMPVLVKSLESAETIAYMSEGARELAKKFWPGPLTIVVRAKDVLSSLLRPKGSVGVRSPDHAICQQLLGLCSGLLVGTSANVTGRPPATSAEEALQALGDRVDIIVDSGRSPLGVSSTVVDLTENDLRILREGPINRQEILRCLRQERRR